MLILVCLLDEFFLGLCYNILTGETGILELASTVTLVLQANRLTKCASHPKNFPLKSFPNAVLVLVISPLS